MLAHVLTASRELNIVNKFCELDLNDLINQYQLPTITLSESNLPQKFMSQESR